MSVKITPEIEMFMRSVGWVWPVRCKDCEYAERSDYKLWCTLHHAEYPDCFEMDPDDYCSQGCQKSAHEPNQGD